MRRRDLVAVVGAAVAWPVWVRAQQLVIRARRIGYLGSGIAVPFLLDVFRQGLHDLGWIEGQNIVIEYRFAVGQSENLTSLAAELVRSNVDVIVASPAPAALAVKNMTTTIPIVGIGFDNPVQHGLIESLAHPGGNVTGLSYSVGPEIFGKDLELLKQLIPEVRLVAVLSNSANPNHTTMVENEISWF